jgi:hypothetical protein
MKLALTYAKKRSEHSLWRRKFSAPVEKLHDFSVVVRVCASAKPSLVQNLELFVRPLYSVKAILVKCIFSGCVYHKKFTLGCFFKKFYNYFINSRKALK